MKHVNDGSDIWRSAAPCQNRECADLCRLPKHKCIRRKLVEYFNGLDKKQKDIIRANAANEVEEIRIASIRHPKAVETVKAGWKASAQWVYRGQLLRFTAHHMDKYGGKL